LRRNLGALEVKAEADFLQALFANGVAELGLVRRVEHEETAARQIEVVAADELEARLL
jgi:hypothetical protein